MIWWASDNPVCKPTTMMDELPTLEGLTFDVGAADFNRDSAIRSLQEFGAIKLRRVFKSEDVDFLSEATGECLQSMSLAGSFGYYRKDHVKKLVDPFLIGGQAVDVCLSEYLIDLVETYMQSECVLSEAFIKEDIPTKYIYFPIHSDYAPGTSRRSGSHITMTSESLKHPVAVGAAL